MYIHMHTIMVEKGGPKSEGKWGQYMERKKGRDLIIL